MKLLDALTPDDRRKVSEAKRLSEFVGTSKVRYNDMKQLRKYAVIRRRDGGETEVFRRSKKPMHEMSRCDKELLFPGRRKEALSPEQQAEEDRRDERILAKMDTMVAYPTLCIYRSNPEKAPCLGRTSCPLAYSCSE
jgi:hypothetical protein